jgi:hypothetical protein
MVVALVRDGRSKRDNNDGTSTIIKLTAVVPGASRQPDKRCPCHEVTCLSQFRVTNSPAKLRPRPRTLLPLRVWSIPLDSSRLAPRCHQPCK